MKQVHVEQLDRSLYVKQPQLAKKEWPYRSQAAPARLSGLGDLKPREFDPDACPDCGGLLWIDRPKNVRTGSRRLVRCRNERHEA